MSISKKTYYVKIIVSAVLLTLIASCKKDWTYEANPDYDDPPTTMQETFVNYLNGVSKKEAKDQCD